MKVFAKLLIFILFIIVFILAVLFGVTYQTIDNNHEPYMDYISQYSQENQLDEALVYAIIDVESKFDPEAKSRAGAIGLMQLLPDTAEWVANRIEIEYDLNKLTEPEYNIQLGTYYLNYLFNLFKSEDHAILAYNGGPGNVSSWLKDEIITNDPKSYQNVPIIETRTYLTRVKESKQVYGRILEPIIKNKELSRAQKAFEFILIELGLK